MCKTANRNILFSEFTTIFNHEESVLTQTIKYEDGKTTFIAPKHASLSEANTTFYHYMNLQVTQLDDMCVLQRNGQQITKPVKHSSSMINYELAKTKDCYRNIESKGLGYLERQDGWSFWSFLAHSGH